MLALTLGLACAATVLEVGPGHAFARIEDAVKAAKPRDVVRVFPDPNNYPKTAVMVKVPLIIVAVSKDGVKVDGSGFDYSGVGSIPRAIFQFEPGSEDSKLIGFDLSGAHNASFNGAGVRIQGASRITVDNCRIHGNDMGIMSNGSDKDPEAGRGQAILYSEIFSNGSEKQPGYNHNLYLGGNSVTLFRCNIHHSLTGHNVKSRARFVGVQGCYSGDCANGELGLPESADTDRKNSNAVIISSRIVKDPNCSGNRGVIHFGQEKGNRTGGLFLLNTVVVTPFGSPVVQVTSKQCPLVLTFSTFINREQSKATLWASSDADQKVVAKDNSLSLAYGKLSDNNEIGSSKEYIFGLDPKTYLPLPVTHVDPKAEPPTEAAQSRWLKTRMITFVDGDGLQVEMEAPPISDQPGHR